MSSLPWPEMPQIGGSDTNSDAWTSLLKVNAEMFVSAPTRDHETIRTFESLALGFLPRMDHAALQDLARILAPCEDTPTAILDHLIQHSPDTRDIVFALSPRMSSSFAKRLLGTPEGRLMLSQRHGLDPFTIERLLVVRESAVEDMLAANSSLAPTDHSFAELMRRARHRPALARLLLKRSDLTIADEAALFLAADPARRAKVRERLAESALTQHPHRSFRLTGADVDELLAIAHRGEVQEFERYLSVAFGFPGTIDWRLLEIGRHDLLALALKALGLASKEANKVFVTLHPALSHSVSVLRALSCVVDDIPSPVALALVEAILGARASDPKVASTFGIDPMLTSSSGASFGAENRVHLSARCASAMPPRSISDRQTEHEHPENLAENLDLPTRPVGASRPKKQ